MKYSELMLGYDLFRALSPLLNVTLQTSSLYILLQTAACLRMLGELREAAEVYEHGRSPMLEYQTLTKLP